MSIPTRGPNSLPCGFDLHNLCDSTEENRGAMKALIALNQALQTSPLSKNEDYTKCRLLVSDFIHWARTGKRPHWFSSEIV